MSISRAEVVDYLANMTVLELSTLIKELEEKFGVSAAAPMAVAAAMPGMAAAEAPAAEEKTEFDVVLTVCGPQQDPGDQGSAGHHQSGPERSQGSGGKRAHHREGSHLQGGSRRGQEETGSPRGYRRGQVGCKAAAVPADDGSRVWGWRSDSSPRPSRGSPSGVPCHYSGLAANPWSCGWVRAERTPICSRPSY